MLISRFIPVFVLRARGVTPSQRLLLAALGCALLVPLALLIDVPVARFCLADRLPGDLQRVLTWSEVVAHGLGIALLAVMICVIDPARRRYLPRLLVGALGAGLAADAMKLVLARLRPRYLELDAGVLDTFAGWFPVLFPVEGQGAFDSRWLSFPSGHTAVAVAFAVGISRLYPHGRWIFGLFALLAACQRIEAGAHYVSDTLAGAAIGFTYLFLLSESRPLTNWFDRFEQDDPASVLD